MPDSSVPAVIDWLVTNIGGLAACKDPVLVSDGYPVTDAAVMVIIGSAVTPVVIGQQAVQTIGQPESETETYVVDVAIHAAAGTSSQKTVRDQVFTIGNAIRALIRSDATLGSLTPLGTHVTNWTLQQTDGEDTDEQLRTAVLTLGIRAQFWLA